MRILYCYSLLLVLLVSISTSDHQFKIDGTVLDLDDSSFDTAISSFDIILVDFYAPWCGHYKRLTPEFEAAAPALAGLKEPIVIAKINADKFTRIASKYDVKFVPVAILLNSYLLPFIEYYILCTSFLLFPKCFNHLAVST